MKRSNRYLLAGGTAAALALGAVLWSGDPQRAPAPPSLAGSAPKLAPRGPDAVAPPAPAPDPACDFQAGERLAWGVQLTSTSELKPLPGQPTALNPRLEVSGQLHLEVLDAEGPQAVLLGRLARLSVSTGGMDPEPLSRPFLVKVDPGCRLVAFARHVDTPRGAARNVQALLWETQFEATPGASFRMANGNGLAVGRIELLAPGALRRVLTRYESLWRAPGQRGGPTESVLVVRRGAGRWFEGLEATESLVVDGTRTQSRLALFPAALEAAGFSASERRTGDYLWEDLLPVVAQELIARPVTKYDRERRAKVATQTPAEAVAALVERKAKGVGIQDTWPDLAAYFEARPEAVAPIVQRYLKGELPPDTAGDFFLALGKARVPEAKQALLALKRDERRVAMDRVRAVFALVVREDVGPELASELARDVDGQLGRADRTSRFLGGEALLALSMMSGTRNDPEVEAIASAAVRRVLLSGPSDLQVVRAALGAVGNLGQGTLLSAALPWVNAADPALRRAATRALGRIPPGESQTVTLQWLGREDDPLVKRDLWTALQEQHYDSGTGASRELVDLALRDLPVMESAFTRRAIVRLLAQSQEAQAPEVRRALVRQARFEREHQTSLLNEFQRWLTQEEVGEVLR